MFWSVFQRRKVMCHHCESHELSEIITQCGAARQRGQEERKKRQETRKGMSAPARIGHMQGVRGARFCPHQHRRRGRASARTSAGGVNAKTAGGEPLPAPAPKENMQGVRRGEHLPAGANARSAGGA